MRNTKREWVKEGSTTNAPGARSDEHQARRKSLPRYSDPMTDVERVLVTAGALAAISFVAFAFRLTRLEPSAPARVVGELRFANLAAVLLCAIGGVYIGLAIAAYTVPAASLDVTLSVLFIGLGGVALCREPRESLLLCAAAFVLHAFFDIAHRPGLLSADLVPRWYSIGCAVFDVVIAAACFGAR